MECTSSGFNLSITLNPAGPSGLRTIMILLPPVFLLLLYVISLVAVLHFRHTGAIVEDGECLDCKARILEGWVVE